MRSSILFLIGLLLGGLAVYFFCCRSSSLVDNLRPKGVISADEAKALSENFNARHRLISDSLVKRGGGDNRSSWYGLEQMRQYLDYAQKETHKMGFDMTGVRIYMGAQPKDDEGEGYSTLFLVPTGSQQKSTAATLNLVWVEKDRDIPGGPALDMGGMGDPPQANYPQ